MTTTPISEQARGNLATLMHAIRPDFDIAGCIAALRKIHPDITLAALTIAVGRYTADDRNLTPAHIADLGNHAWDTDAYPPCPTHGHAPRRLSGECGHCYADRKADETSTAARTPTPPPKSLRELVKAERSHPGNNQETR